MQMLGRLVAAMVSVTIVLPSLRTKADGGMKSLPFDVDLGKAAERWMPTGCPAFEIAPPREKCGLVVKAEDFGLSETNENNFAAIQAALDEAKRVGAAKVVLKPGIYRCFGGSGYKLRSSLPAEGIVLDGFEDFVFDGAGAELVFRRPSTYPMVPGWDHDSLRANFVIRNCRRVTVGNFSMDWDWRTMPLATCAKVAAVHVDEKVDNASYCDFELLGHGERHPFYGQRFPVQRTQPMTSDFKRFLKGLNWWHGTFEGDMAAKTQWLAPTRIRVYPAVVDPTAPRWTGPGERKFNPAMNRKWAGQMKVGDYVRIAHAYYGKGGFTLDSNSDFTLHDVNVYSCYGFGVYVDGTQTRWAMRNVSFAPRDWRHPISSTADSVHFVRSCGKALFDNLTVRFEADDAINVHDRFTVVKRIGKRELKVVLERGARYFLPAVGNDVELRDPGYNATGWKGGCVRVEGETVLLDRDLPASDPEEGYFLLFDRTASSDDVIIRNCIFDDMENRVLVNVSNVTIENCLFRRTNFDALRCIADYTLKWWAEGMGTTNVVVRNCRFEDNCVRECVGEVWSLGADISCWLGRPKQVDESRLDRRFISDILVEGCAFRDSLGYFADLRFGTGFTFRNNLIERTGHRAECRETSGSVRLERVGNVCFENNEFRIPDGMSIPHLFVADGVEGVSLKGNRIVRIVR